MDQFVPLTGNFCTTISSVRLCNNFGQLMCCVISWLVKKSDLGILKQGKRNFRMACCRNWSPEMVSLIKVD